MMLGVWHNRWWAESEASFAVSRSYPSRVVKDRHDMLVQGQIGIANGLKKRHKFLLHVGEQVRVGEAKSDFGH